MGSGTSRAWAGRRPVAEAWVSRPAGKRQSPGCAAGAASFAWAPLALAASLTSAEWSAPSLL